MVAAEGGGRVFFGTTTGSGTGVDKRGLTETADEGTGAGEGVEELVFPPLLDTPSMGVRGPGVDTEVEDVLFLVFAAEEILDSTNSSSNFFLLMDLEEILLP